MRHVDATETLRATTGAEPTLAAISEPFDSFWEGPEDVERGYATFYRFYRANYLPHLPADRAARVLVISCGPGYFVETLRRHGYEQVIGIDSDPAKIAHARQRGLDCRVARAFGFLAGATDTFDAIVCEQELNHLTKAEMRAFLDLVRARLAGGGTLVVHGLNGANPITGAEALAQNIDHFNTFTEYSLRQILDHAGFVKVNVFPLHLYVFYENPMNYIAWGASWLLNCVFRAGFILYGKSNRIFAKKIGAVCHKPDEPVGHTGRPQP